MKNDDEGQSTSAPNERERARGAFETAALVVVCIAAVVAFIGPALSLLFYPFDWAPEEGLALDYAHRLTSDPATLYPSSGSAVPFPLAYTPLFPVMLAPFLQLFDAHFIGPRLLVLALLVCLVVVLRKLIGGPARVAVMALAFALANGKMFSYLAIVRVDLPMILFAFAFLLVVVPTALDVREERISWRRAGLASILLALAMLTKPTAVVYVLPACAVWLRIDFRSAMRLAALCTLALIVVFTALEIGTDGGFARTMALWGTHPALPHRVFAILKTSFGYAWPTLVPIVVVIAVSGAHRRAVFMDGAVLIALSALTVIPLVFKAGAFFTYFIPPLLGVAIWVGRVHALLPSLRARRTLDLSLAIVAVYCAIFRGLPLPTDDDVRTADALYAYVAHVTEDSEAPIIATRPDFAYVVAKRPMEIEGSSFMHLMRAGAPGMRGVVTRIESETYSLILADPTFYASVDTLLTATHAHYEPVAACALGTVHGLGLVYVFLPKSAEKPPFVTGPGIRCQRSPLLPPSFCREFAGELGCVDMPDKEPPRE